jgi:hypothetical protein
MDTVIAIWRRFPIWGSNSFTYSHWVLKALIGLSLLVCEAKYKNFAFFVGPLMGWNDFLFSFHHLPPVRPAGTPWRSPSTIPLLPALRAESGYVRSPEQPDRHPQSV